MSLPSRSRPRRLAVLLLGGALAVAGSFGIAASSASAVEYYNVISGSGAYLANSFGEQYVSYSDEILVELVDPDTDAVLDSTHTSGQHIGYFWFHGVAPGDYNIVFTSEDANLPADPVTYELLDVPQRTFVPEQHLLPRYLDGGAVTVSGTPALGETVTSDVAEFTGTGPVDPDISYLWGYSGPTSGGEIDGATGPSVVIPPRATGAAVYVVVTGVAEGYAVTQTMAELDGTVTAPQLPAAPAPVADSADLGSYLAAHYAYPNTASTVGLPDTGLSPLEGYTARLDGWYGGDFFVDVYAYSSPRLIGTFPVTNGSVVVSLTQEVLAALGTGAHTLVYVGQTSGMVSSVTFQIVPALAATGADLTEPLAAGSALLLLGSAFMIMHRRRLGRA